MELDALEPQVFMNILDECIRDNLDKAKYNHQMELQEHDVGHIADIRERAIERI